MTFLNKCDELERTLVAEFYQRCLRQGTARERGERRAELIDDGGARWRIRPAEDAADVPARFGATDRYERRFPRWALEQVALLRAGRFDALDLDHIAEELRTWAARSIAELESAWRILLMHMLKWDHHPRSRRAGHAIASSARRIDAASRESGA